MTTIREAILAAAAHIEANPSSYRFRSNSPPHCGTPGCMMGWIGFHMGISGPADGGYMDAVRQACGFDYCDLGDFARETSWYSTALKSYTSDAGVAARIMREFADARFPTKHAAPHPATPCVVGYRPYPHGC